MTTTSETRPLPLDLATLRQHYYPLEPETAVSRAATAIGRIDQVIAAVREEITRRDEHDHQLVSDLIAAAITGDKLEPIAARMVPGDRAAPRAPARAAAHRPQPRRPRARPKPN